MSCSDSDEEWETDFAETEEDSELSELPWLDGGDGRYVGLCYKDNDDPTRYKIGYASETEKIWCECHDLAAHGFFHEASLRIPHLNRGGNIQALIDTVNQGLAAEQRKGTRKIYKAPKKSTKQQYSAVVWDLDGTLLDTEILSTQALNQCLEPFNAHCDWILKKKLLGRRAPDWCTVVINERKLHGKITPNEMHQQWEHNLNELCPLVDKCKGAMSIVNYFTTMNVSQSIATSSTRPAVVLKRKKHEDLFSQMTHVTTGDQVKNGKPAPDMYLHAAQLLGLGASKCIAFEDSLAGVKSAVSAGMCCFAIVDERFEEKDLVEFQKIAFRVVRSLEEALVVVRAECEYVKI
jgi:beta-phosphoglucomutase-like phosphatase (HAD superfamily)